MLALSRLLKNVIVSDEFYFLIYVCLVNIAIIL